MTATESTDTVDALVDEIHAWLSEYWDPELTLAEWWQRLGKSGWSAPTLPEDGYGRGLSRSDTVTHAEIAAFGAVGPPSGLGLLLAAPTIATHGTREQIDAYVRDIVTGQPRVVSALQRTRGRFGSRRSHDARRTGRRRVGRDRSEGVDLHGPNRRPRHAPRSYQP